MLRLTDVRCCISNGISRLQSLLQVLDITEHTISPLTIVQSWIINQLAKMVPTKHPIKRRESSCFKFVGINNMDQWSIVCFPVGLLLRRKCTRHGNKNSIVTLGYPVAHCMVCCGSWLGYTCYLTQLLIRFTRKKYSLVRMDFSWKSIRDDKVIQ